MIFNEAREKSSILQVFPFNSEKKRGGVAVHVVIGSSHISTFNFFPNHVIMILFYSMLLYKILYLSSQCRKKNNLVSIRLDTTSVQKCDINIVIFSLWNNELISEQGISSLFE